MRYHIITYGCQMNKSDSERITSILEKSGYKPASKETEADLIVVNMCSVRQSAVDRVYGLTQKLKNLKTKKHKLKTILTGCILKGDRRKFTKGFDLILDIKNLPNWPKLFFYNFDGRPKHRITWDNVDNEGDSRCDYFGIEPKYQNNFRAFIPISNGCNNFCTYCVVPYTRGPLVLRPWKEVLAETKSSIKRGVKEIWLLGQNVNSYRDSGMNFSKLLEMINDIPGNFWIRFTSPHPADFTDDLIGVMAKCKKVTPYLNLPVQSGDNEILRKMNRPYTREYYKNLVKKIREKVPDINLSTDVIVGFPGETKKQFQNTIKLFKGIKFDMAYIARYSPRPGTTAAKMKDNVPFEEKERRWKILTEALKRSAFKINKKCIGKEVEVLAEEWKNEFLIGKTRSCKTLKFRGSKNLIGNFIKVKIIDALSWGLKAHIINK